MTAYPPMSFTDIIEYQPRIEALAEPHVWMLPRRDVELDADRIIATYQQTTRDTLAAMREATRRETLRSANELCALTDAYVEKAQRNR